MGHKEMTMTVAEKEKGGGTLRRMILVLAAVALMAVMMVAMAAPAFARSFYHGGPGGPAPESTGETSGTCISRSAGDPGSNSASAHDHNPNLGGSDVGAGLCAR